MSNQGHPISQNILEQIDYKLPVYVWVLYNKPLDKVICGSSVKNSFGVICFYNCVEAESYASNFLKEEALGYDLIRVKFEDIREVVKNCMPKLNCLLLLEGSESEVVHEVFVR